MAPYAEWQDWARQRVFCCLFQFREPCFGSNLYWFSMSTHLLKFAVTDAFTTARLNGHRWRSGALHEVGRRKDHMYKPGERTSRLARSRWMRRPQRRVSFPTQLMDAGPHSRSLLSNRSTRDVDHFTSCCTFLPPRLGPPSVACRAEIWMRSEAPRQRNGTTVRPGAARSCTVSDHDWHRQLLGRPR
jgi:hypothetical protein